MRFAVVMFVTILLSLGASWLRWGNDMILRPIPPPGMPPTAVQRQFGPRVGPQIAAALERNLPANFDTTGGFDATIARLRDASGVRIFVNWRSLEQHGGLSERTPLDVSIGGMPFREALTKLLA